VRWAADEHAIVPEGHPIDGSLCSWEEVLQERSDWSALLLGNGLSRDVSGNYVFTRALRRSSSNLGSRSTAIVGPGRCSSQDNHLVEALNQNPGRPVAVSILRKGKGRREIQSAKAGLRGVLHASPLYFFDSATHPLGTATIRHT